jgi:hypothetical protein
MADLKRFLPRDPQLAHVLHRFRSSGKRLFLLTNSHWDYTRQVMHYLLGGQLDPYPSWAHYFDLVIVAARKPGFFSGRAAFGRPDELGDETDRRLFGELFDQIRDKVWSGGNIEDLRQLHGVRGERVLFVGDHIYGDVLRPKKHSLWRTAMIVPELEQEIEVTARASQELALLRTLEVQRESLDGEINFHRTVARALERLERQLEEQQPDTAGLSREAVGLAMKKALHNLKTLRQTMKGTLRRTGELRQLVDREFNESWGPLFRMDNEQSRFSEQVETYACLYTSRVSNFAYCSPVQYFRSPPEMLPHERVFP